MDALQGVCRMDPCWRRRLEHALTRAPPGSAVDGGQLNSALLQRSRRPFDQGWREGVYVHRREPAI